MDIPPNINQNIDFNMKQMNITDLPRYNYNVKRFTPAYTDNFISLFDDDIKVYLENKNYKLEKEDVILLTPHPIPYNAVTD